MPKATVTASADRSAAGRLVASPRTSVTRLSSRRRRSLAAPTPSIAPAKSTPMTRRAAGECVTAAIATSPVPVHTSITRFSTGELQRFNRALAPALVDAGAEKVVEEIVALGDGVEHAGDFLRRLGDIDHRSPPVITKRPSRLSRMVYYRSPIQDERRVRKERRESKGNLHSAILAASAFLLGPVPLLRTRSTRYQRDPSTRDTSGARTQGRPGPCRR